MKDLKINTIWLFFLSMPTVIICRNFTVFSKVSLNSWNTSFKLLIVKCRLHQNCHRCEEHYDDAGCEKHVAPDFMYHTLCTTHLAPYHTCCLLSNCSHYCTQTRTSNMICVTDGIHFILTLLITTMSLIDCHHGWHGMHSAWYALCMVYHNHIEVIDISCVTVVQ